MNKKLMVFDWEKAAKLIKEKNAMYAIAGLKDDWDYTAGIIFENGKPVKQEKTYTYLASIWAMPILEIDGKIFQCYKIQNETDNWNAKTFWPEIALNIINE